MNKLIFFYLDSNPQIPSDQRLGGACLVEGHLRNFTEEVTKVFLLTLRWLRLVVFDSHVWWVTHLYNNPWKHCQVCCLTVPFFFLIFFGPSFWWNLPSNLNQNYDELWRTLGNIFTYLIFHFHLMHNKDNLCSLFLYK